MIIIYHIKQVHILNQVKIYLKIEYIQINLFLIMMIVVNRVKINYHL